MQKLQITKEGHKKLKNEIDNLKNIQRPKIIEQIAEARDHGDLKENAEYHSAREKQGLVEAQILDLEDRLLRSEIVDVNQLSGDIVIFGATVTLDDIDNEKQVCYKIVSEYEANIDSGLISITSPVARSLINKKIGDEIEVNTPGGTITYEILAVNFNQNPSIES